MAVALLNDKVILGLGLVGKSTIKDRLVILDWLDYKVG